MIETASPGVGGNTCNGTDESADQPCLPNWVQRVWSWWGWAHASWWPEEITVSALSSSPSNEGMIAPRVTIQTANPALKRSLMHPFIHSMLTTLGWAQQGVNRPVPEQRLADSIGLDRG